MDNNGRRGTDDRGRSAVFRPHLFDPSMLSSTPGIRLEERSYLANLRARHFPHFQALVCP
jgi:hypothetical protein